MRAKFLLCLGFGALVSSNWASAQSEDQPGITYDCDTAANHFSELILPTPSAPFSVTGRVKLMSLAESKEYLPLTRLSVSQHSAEGEPSVGDWAGFEFLVAPTKKGRKPDLPLLAFSEMLNGEKHDSDFAGEPSGMEVPFRLSYDGTTAVTQLDGHEKRMAFTASTPIVRILCSTGEFLYRDLKVAPLD